MQLDRVFYRKFAKAYALARERYPETPAQAVQRANPDVSMERIRRAVTRATTLELLDRPRRVDRDKLDTPWRNTGTQDTETPGILDHWWLGQAVKSWKDDDEAIVTHAGIAAAMTEYDPDTVVDTLIGAGWTKRPGRKTYIPPA